MGFFRDLVDRLYKYLSGPNIPIRDRLGLSPWEKWHKYHRFPWKILVHSAIVIVVTLQILLITANFTPYGSQVNQSFRTLFNIDEIQEGLFTYEDTLQAINQSLYTYYDIPELSVSRFLITDEDGVPFPIELEYQRYKAEFYNKTTNDYNYDLFNDLSLRKQRVHIYSKHDLNTNLTDSDLFYDMYRISSKFVFKNLGVGILGPVPFLWNVTLIYNFGSGRVDVSYLAQKKVIEESSSNLTGTLSIFVWLNILQCFLSFVSVTLSMRSLIANWNLYQKTKRQYNIQMAMNAQIVTKNKAFKRVTLADYYSSWDRVPLGVKIQFFNLWHIWITISNLFLIPATIFGLASEYGTTNEEGYHILLGIGAFMSCVNIIRYLEYTEQFYVLILTMRKSFLRISRFLISVIPIFFGYCLFGIVCFSSYYEEFGTLDDTAVTLFALLNGDSILQVFDDLKEAYPYLFISRVYLYSFILFFITAVLNIFIFIIEDAYHSAKSWGKKHKMRKQSKGDKPDPPKFNINRLFEVLQTSKKHKKKPGWKWRIQHPQKPPTEQFAPVVNIVNASPDPGRSSFGQRDWLTPSPPAGTLPGDQELQPIPSRTSQPLITITDDAPLDTALDIGEDDISMSTDELQFDTSFGMNDPPLHQMYRGRSNTGAAPAPTDGRFDGTFGLSDSPIQPITRSRSSTAAAAPSRPRTISALRPDGSELESRASIGSVESDPNVDPYSHLHRLRFGAELHEILQDLQHSFDKDLKKQFKKISKIQRKYVKKVDQVLCFVLEEEIRKKTEATQFAGNYQSFSSSRTDDEA